VTTASDDPEQIRRQIERTQANLGQDVDALTEKVTPGKIVQRGVDRARGAATRLKDTVMGSNPVQASSHAASGVRSTASDAADRVSSTASAAASTVQDTASSAAGTVQDAASAAAGTVQDAAPTAVGAVQEAPQAIRRQTQGNPLAAGLIAFGVGWLVSSLMPATEKERQLAQQAETAVRENKDALLAPAKQVAQELKEELQPAAQQAAQEVKATAQDAAQTVKQEGQSAAQDVQGQAQQSRQTVQGQTRS
jgi:hypothetical protein